MNAILITFAVLAVLAIAGIGYFLRGVLWSISTLAADHARTYALAYCKASALIFIAMLAGFDEQFRGLSKEAAAVLPWWGWAVMLFKPVAAGAAVLVAFLDRSAQTATAEAKVDKAEKAAKAATTPPFPVPPAQ